MKVLITGGAGYIGSVLTGYLIKKKFKVYIIDNFSTSHKINTHKKSKLIKKDIRDTNFLTKFLIKNKIKNVIHLAAKMSNHESTINPLKYYDNNINGTFSVVIACNRAKVRNLVFSSSCAVYGTNQTKNIAENHPLKPVAPYGLSKILSEEIITHNRNKLLKFAILRYFNVIGADYDNKKGQVLKNNQLFQNISLSIINKKKFIVYGNKFSTRDGYAIRDFIDVNDLADLHYKFLAYIDKKNKNILVNCGYGKGYSVMEVIKKFEKITKKKLNYKIANIRSGDIPYSVSNIKKLNKTLNWKPKFSDINISIKNTMLWNKFLKTKL